MELIFFEVLFFVLRLRPPPTTLVVVEARLPTPVTDGIARRGQTRSLCAARQQRISVKGYHTPPPIPSLKVRLLCVKST